jgi:hypothetical protein
MVVPPPFCKNAHFLRSFSHSFLKSFSTSAASAVERATLQPMARKPGQEDATAKPLPKSNMKRTRKPSSKVVEAAGADTTDNDDTAKQNDDTAKQTSKARRISWTSARTERLLDWLDENPVDRQKLFSDSSKDAKEEGRRKRVAKGTKSEFHKMIATFVFSADADSKTRLDFSSNAGNYTKSVDNYLARYVFVRNLFSF